MGAIIGKGVDALHLSEVTIRLLFTSFLFDFYSYLALCSHNTLALHTGDRYTAATIPFFTIVQRAAMNQHDILASVAPQQGSMNIHSFQILIFYFVGLLYSKGPIVGTVTVRKQLQLR